MNRFFCKNLTTDNIELDGPEASHMINVMRLKPGEHVELFDGKGTLAEAVIMEVKKKVARLQIENSKTQSPPANNRIIIAASIAKGQRLDWMVSKCTELGVDHIFPVICERTVKLSKGANAVERLEKLTISSAKQCKRLFLPTISKPQSLTDSLSSIKQTYPDCQMIFGGLNQNTRPINHIKTNTDTVAFIGPEGGFTTEEQTFLEQNAVTPTKLTDTVLRTETAAIALASILCIQRDSIL